VLVGLISQRSRVQIPLPPLMKEHKEKPMSPYRDIKAYLDFCINCGHYHVPEDDPKKARHCVRGSECYCSVKDFTKRSNKRSFA
jgi:hypothetical protein